MLNYKKHVYCQHGAGDLPYSSSAAAAAAAATARVACTRGNDSASTLSRFVAPREISCRSLTPARHPPAASATHPRRDGTPFWNQLFITPLLDSSGGVQSFVGVLQEVVAPPQFLPRVQQGARATKTAASPAQLPTMTALSSANPAHKVHADDEDNGVPTMDFLGPPL